MMITDYFWNLRRYIADIKHTHFIFKSYHFAVFIEAGKSMILAMSFQYSRHYQKLLRLGFWEVQHVCASPLLKIVITSSASSSGINCYSICIIKSQIPIFILTSVSRSFLNIWVPTLTVQNRSSAKETGNVKIQPSALISINIDFVYIIATSHYCLFLQTFSEWPFVVF